MSTLGGHLQKESASLAYTWELVTHGSISKPIYTKAGYMILRSLSIGQAVPLNFTATVHSAFRSALNLRLSDDDRLLTLLSADQADLPQGIRLDTPADFSFERFSAADIVFCRANRLHLATLTIELSEASRWHCDLPSLRADLAQTAVAAAWQRAWETLNQHQMRAQTALRAEELWEGKASNELSQRAGAALRHLWVATRQFDCTAASRAAHSLIGLGPGLTPSGDDLLLGYLSGLWCTVHGKAQRLEFLSQFGESVISLSRHTTQISRTFLFYAAHGQVSSHLYHLARAICQAAEPSELSSSLQAVFAMGHSSGMDALTGLLFGLTAWPPLESDRMQVTSMPFLLRR